MGRYVSTRPLSPLDEGWKSCCVKVNCGSVGDSVVSKELTELLGSSNWIIKEVRIYFAGSPTADAYMHINTSATDTESTRFGEIYYYSGFILNIDGNKNGRIGTPLSSKPYLFIFGGTGSVASNVYATIIAYFKS